MELQPSVFIETTVVKHKRNRIIKNLTRDRYLYIMITPGILFFLIFSYFPLYGLILAFKDFKFNLGIWGSPWTGLDHFQMLFDDADFWVAFKNTIVISLGKIIFGFPVPIILALMLNELRVKFFKNTVQTFLYLPYFLSWVIMAGIIFNLLSVTSGTLPKLLETLFGIHLPKILGSPEYFKSLIFISHIWKTMGWETIIYLAAIAGISPHLYEAAIIDGANRFQRVIHITLPSLTFVIAILLVLSIGGVMNAGFDQIFNLYDPGVYKVGDILDTFVYRVGIASGTSHMEDGVVIGLVKGVLNLVLLVGANQVVKLLRQESIF
ncbi:putative aldouronate transport system permease protein [Paenibacillus sp. yr247]|uniref:ABC transporter permease n=1 Tax=Paenibacillus sp. yr247 TaxID=1761880 RepID=UPI00087E2FB5|nr:ABC transporter permease subunit [Paenibacillus sp. yr247]SDN97134.1 putative aldouronate transport system permease protein [Paenibacillus sp. yr247]